MALHPIPSELLRCLTHEERVDLANTIDRAIRAIKPKSPQAADAFTLEETIKRILCLGVNKKKAVESARAKSLMTTKDSRVELVQAVEKENVEFPKASRYLDKGSKNMTKKMDIALQNTVTLGSRIEGRSGLGGYGLTRKERAKTHRLEVLERLQKTRGSSSATTSQKDDGLAQATGSLPLSRRVQDVDTHEYGKNSAPSSE